MSFPLQLPYYAPSALAALPSIEEIKAATLICDNRTQRVAKVSDQFIVKYGSQVSLIEGENLVYIKQATKLSVTHVYALFRDFEEDCNYIIMEYVPGTTLESAWPRLNNLQKQAITLTLRNYMEELRMLPSPGYFGSIGERPLLESMFWTPESLASISGPFNSEAELNEAMAQKYSHFGAPIYKANLYRRAFPRVLSGHLAVFTHADFQRKNIIVNFDPDNGVSITIVDWEKSGWLPSYWEYAMAMLSDRFEDDWNEWLGIILEPFYAEYPYLKMLQLELWS